MEFVSSSLICDMYNDMYLIQCSYPESASILRYLCCIRHYEINTIIIGQNPYSSGIVPPILGSAFSHSMDIVTPTTEIFSLHFKDKSKAQEFLAESWKMLPMGIAFVNADYYPASLGGGNSDPSCHIRINRTVEMLFASIVCRDIQPKSIRVMCAGNIAAGCGSTLSRRLRALGIKVTQSNFKQPVALSRITCNHELVGKDPNYMFCSPSILEWFECRMDESKDRNVYTEADILKVVKFNMSDEKISPMTKSALEAIAAIIKNLDERLNTPYSKETANEKELRKIMLEHNQVLHSVIQLLTADAQTYNVITTELTAQLPTASREQFATADSSYVFDSSHGSEFDHTTLESVKSPTQKTKAGSKSHSLFAPESKSSSKKSKKKKVKTPSTIKSETSDQNLKSPPENLSESFKQPDSEQKPPPNSAAKALFTDPIGDLSNLTVKIPIIKDNKEEVSKKLIHEEHITDPKIVSAFSSLIIEDKNESAKNIKSSEKKKKKKNKKDESSSSPKL